METVSISFLISFYAFHYLQQVCSWEYLAFKMHSGHQDESNAQAGEDQC